LNLRIIHEDCLVAMRTLIDEGVTVQAIVCDPPYGLEFMGKDWDGSDGFRRSLNAADVGRENVFGRQSKRAPEYRAGHLFQEWCEAWASLVLKLLPPGGHLVAFGGTRTYHRLACAIEDAGFEIRDQIQWIYGSGFPKSKNDGEGRGTALKPASEPIVLARKPLMGTVAANFAAHGTGYLNIDDCRVGPGNRISGGGNNFNAWRQGEARDDRLGIHANASEGHDLGRWPANVVHDGSDEVTDLFPRTKSGTGAVKRESGAERNGNRGAAYGAESRVAGTVMRCIGDEGSAARFFYHAKASKADRMGFTHPTIKPVNLMRWLVRLVTPEGGLVLDPFAGTGTTGAAALTEGRSAILIELDAGYVANIRTRLDVPLPAESTGGIRG
jgi:site-specific DNA-methyltransferase (adenine-specific)